MILQSSTAETYQQGKLEVPEETTNVLWSSSFERHAVELGTTCACRRAITRYMCLVACPGIVIAGGWPAIKWHCCSAEGPPDNCVHWPHAGLACVDHQSCSTGKAEANTVREVGSVATQASPSIDHSGLWRLVGEDITQGAC